MHWGLKTLIYIFIAPGAVRRWLSYLKFSWKGTALSIEPEPICFGGSQEARTMKRAVGYCMNTECDYYSKGTFLLNHGATFTCTSCRQEGHIEPEGGKTRGDGDIFKEVRVEYNFNAISGKYQEIAVVRDESLWGSCSAYILQSPLVKTEKRALRVAEAILANLNRYRDLLDGNSIPRTAEVTLSFDDSYEDFSRNLNHLGEIWAAADLRGRRRARGQASQ